MKFGVPMKFGIYKCWLVIVIPKAEDGVTSPFTMVSKLITIPDVSGSDCWVTISMLYTHIHKLHQSGFKLKIQRAVIIHCGKQSL